MINNIITRGLCTFKVLFIVIVLIKLLFKVIICWIHCTFCFICTQDGLNSLQESMCDHLQTVLNPLAASGKLQLSTSGPLQADKSLLNADHSFWDTASVQQDAGILRSLYTSIIMFIIDCVVLYDLKNAISVIIKITIIIIIIIILLIEISEFDSLFMDYIDSSASEVPG